MITPEMVYWIGVLDGIRSAIGHVIFFCLVITLVSAFISAIAFSEGSAYGRKLLKLAVSLSILVVLLGIGRAFIPTTQLAAAMYIVPAIANNENIQAIGNNSLEGLRILTEEWLKDLADMKEKREL